MPPNNVNFSESSEFKDSDFDFGEFFRTIWGWIIRTAYSINDETLAHPYYIVLALFIVCAWPHILALPFWFGHDAYRRMERQTRQAVGRVARDRPQRKRDIFIARYRAIISSSEDRHPPMFGGTPLSSGNFAVEEERTLPLTLRVIRWLCLGWALFIIGREGYFFYERRKW